MIRMIHISFLGPSRSELVTGKYFHNLKQEGGGCMHIDEDKVNPDTFAKYLHARGYTVGMFGKYLNSNPKVAPPGIDAYMTNGGGNYYAPQFDTVGVADLAPYYMADGAEAAAVFPPFSLHAWKTINHLPRQARDKRNETAR